MIYHELLKYILPNEINRKEEQKRQGYSQKRYSSGSHKEPKSEWVQPRVSPYRLATHLTFAFVIYSGILWMALFVVMPEPPSELLNWVHGATKIRRLALPASFIVSLITASGAFVADNDAGHAYNTFPKMGDVWVPDDIFRKEPLIRNFFENTSLVQLNHRILTMTTLLAVGALWLASKRINLHPAAQSLIGSTLGMATLQVTLGLSTLLMYVPNSLASAHQAGALTMLSLMILLGIHIKFRGETMPPQFIKMQHKIVAATPQPSI